MILRALVVDDEPLGRRGVTSRLARRPDVEIVAECASGRAAVDAVRKHAPDLLFLDVQMPGMDGFAVLESLPERERPYTIFVTAHETHAVKAFEVDALDYLLKPIDDARFDEAVSRASRAIGRSKQSQSATAGGGRLSIRCGSRVVFLHPAEVEWISSEGDYVRVHAGPGSWLVRATITSFATALRERGFLRIHRSAIVNADHIREVLPLDNGDCSLTLRSGGKLRMSRTYRDALSQLIREP
jgi:two-component system LytT family response regulator